MNDNLQSGRRSQTFAMIPEWVLLADISAPALRLYGLLLASVNRRKGDGRAWPGMDVLAEMMGYQHRQSIAKFVKELVALGAIEVTTKYWAHGRRNTYVVHETPPTGYSAATSLKDFYARRRAGGDTALSPPADSSEAETPQVTGGSHAYGCDGSHASGCENQTKGNQTNSFKDSPPARPPADAVRDDDMSSWMSYDNEDIEGDILDFVEKRFSYGAFVGQPVVDAMLCRGEPLPKVLNTAMKIAREWSA